MCTMLTALLAGPPDVAGPPDLAPDAAVRALRDQPDRSAAPREPMPAPPRQDDPGDVPSRRTDGFAWPLPGSPEVVRSFEKPVHRFGPGHRGVDLAAVAGTPVLAAGAGTVVFAGQVAGRGVVSVEHRGGLRTTYEPVSPSVAAGDLVVRGQQIGTVAPGHVGCPAAACLHWGARRGMDYLDPLGLLALGRVRLLPWADGPGGG